MDVATPDVGGEPELATARNNYTCFDCMFPIYRGSKYYSIRGLWEGEWQKFNICRACHDVRDKLGFWGEDGAAFGFLRENVAEYNYNFPNDDVAERWLTRQTAMAFYNIERSGNRNQLLRVKEDAIIRKIRSTPEYANIPHRFLRAYIKWALLGHGAGDFVMSTLRNNLQQSFAHADMDAKMALPAIVTFIYNRMPSQCWGSTRLVKEWQGDWEWDFS